VGINNKILKKLDEWQQSEDSLPEGIEFYKRLLVAQNDTEEKYLVPEPTLSQSDIEGRLKQGINLLVWEDLSLDWIALQNLFNTIATLTVEYYADVEGDLKPLMDFASDLSTLQEATKIWYHNQPLSQLADAHSVSEGLLSALIHSAVKPFLTTRSEALIKLMDQQWWRRRYCPVCAGKPDFAFLSGKHGSDFLGKERRYRWLLCSRCDAQWLFQRQQCPYCGNQDQDALSYFTDDAGLYRLYVCQRCLGYLKTIDLSQTKEEILLPLERLLTIDMDRQGQEKGYKSLPFI